MTVGEAITKYRKKCNLTQKELAELMYVSPDLVSMWERGNRMPDYPTVLKLSGIFGVLPESLIDREIAVAEELRNAAHDNIDIPELKECVNSFLETLTEKQRVIFVMRYYRFLDTKTISDQLDTTDGYIRNTLVRIRRKFRKFITRRQKQ